MDRKYYGIKKRTATINKLPITQAHKSWWKCLTTLTDFKALARSTRCLKAFDGHFNIFMRDDGKLERTAAILVLVRSFWYVDYFGLLPSQRLLSVPSWSAYQPANHDDEVLVDESRTSLCRWQESLSGPSS